MAHLTRRQFLGSTASASLIILPKWALSPNEKLSTAHIGVGGMGGSDLRSISGHPLVDVVALCDVDSNRLNAAAKGFPKARKFSDFRVMFSKMANSFDAVVISTPDHTHAAAAMTALNHGKHVYCQKPLTHELYEARQLNEVAKVKGLVTQMGIQVHASVAYRTATRIIQAGAIGKVHEVHAWSFKNWGYDGGSIKGSDPVPQQLAWDLWLGTGEARPYKRGIYHPGRWRKMVEFGTGTLGDMGVHIFDTPYRALELTTPRWVRVECRPPTGVGHPEKNRIEYEFPGTAHTTDTVRWLWYDGAEAPPRNIKVDLGGDRRLPRQGALLIGEKGSCLLPHVGTPELYPKKKFAGYEMPKLNKLNHWHQWVDACLGKTKTSANFGYAGPLTESLLLGVIANRFPGTRLDWDSDKMRVTNVSEANALVRRNYREGFEVKGL